jgi:hypothetical protein
LPEGISLDKKVKFPKTPHKKKHKHRLICGEFQRIHNGRLEHYRNGDWALLAVMDRK